MTIYTTRYQAQKHAASTEKVVKTCGGYVIMTYKAYAEWKRQK